MGGYLIGASQGGVRRSFFRFKEISNSTVNQRASRGANDSTFFHCFANNAYGGLLAAITC